MPAEGRTNQFDPFIGKEPRFSLVAQLQLNYLVYWIGISVVSAELSFNAEGFDDQECHHCIRAVGLTVGIAVGGAARAPGGEGLNSRSSIFL